ncbi:BlaI/MecI/CopY family transcriptional regulator [Cellvibrio sp. NN19]|uniref:BlaI/MecI/CopY family transcriptional regulator n=1 Tax=Cellvibrio chitinivorans TaxID=3102792 RepID=UPI002B40E0CD|nr:BlaI/MecI/CopY family transcriptional regulator [Cellvibrio sp. NN19]
MDTNELQLSDSEWALMKILWDKAPASANQIAELTPQWHLKTVRTMLIRLQKKGAITHELVDGIQHFQPVYERDYCESSATQSFMQRVFDGALTPMIAHFTRQQKLTDEEKKALIALLQDNSEQTNKNQGEQ